MPHFLHSLLVGLLFLTNAAHAAEAPAVAKETKTSKAAPPQGACQKDAEKHCSGFGMHDGLTRCLSDHKEELSEICAASLKPAKK